ncbi:nitroreductase family protein [Helicobacter sp. 11-8110]|uniref:nitroreductase family protein n=1 Tax=Helicobacter sp. 11-8110 TaxID=2004997 RepID=UPI000DCBE261|nr:nitroreductase family protein [Helicobacter sp. 11-8110]RAX53311.1 NAD(P)H-dependent oxidoreductase [Helicobacter sp. 11-8110]
MQKEAFSKIINQRYSCREFKESLLKREDLEYILEAGRLSPSSLGLEPWKFLVVQDSNKKEEISKIANYQGHVKKCGAIIIILARLDFEEYFIPKLQARGMKEEELQKRINLYKPFIESMNEDEKLHYAKEQTYLALGNLANAACAIGLGSCIVGGFDSKALDCYLKLDTTKERSSIMLIVGEYENKAISQKARFSKEEVITFLD